MLHIPIREVKVLLQSLFAKSGVSTIFIVCPLQGTGARFLKVPARKAICEIANRLFWKAGPFNMFSS